MIDPVAVAAGIHAKLLPLEGKRTRFAVDRYPALASEIPDKAIVIQDVVPLDELKVAGERCAPYLANDSVFPILGTLGGNIVGIGYGELNHGAIYYFDFDFGLFKLTDTIDDFLQHVHEGS